MTPPRITYGPWGETLAELIEASVAAERAGAQVLWFPELHRSATVTAAAVAQATTTARIGTAIALAFVRSPMTTALEALDVDELSDGRFVLGLGTGVQRLNENWHNARWGRPAAHLRETVAAIRRFVAVAATGDPIRLDGEWEPMQIRGYQRPFPQVRTEIPVYIAAMGPVMTRLAGEIGDGWISHELCSLRYLEDRVTPQLEAGLERSERDRGDLDVVISAVCAIDPDPATARRWAAGTVGFYASVRSYADFFDFHGFGAGHRAVVDVFGRGASADDLAAAVPQEMVEALTLCGTGPDVQQQLAQYTGIADTIKLTPPTHGLAPEETRRAQQAIIEMIADITGSTP